jgi:hypothetical protein
VVEIFDVERPPNMVRDEVLYFLDCEFVEIVVKSHYFACFDFDVLLTSDGACFVKEADFMK